MKALIRLLILLALLFCIAAAVSLRSFRVLLNEDLVATVECERAPETLPYPYLLEITQMEGKSPLLREKFPMIGDQWSIGGEILKWKPWLNFLGFKTCHKLTRLSSRYEKVELEMTRPRFAYELNGGTTLLWYWLRRWGRWLPLVDAVYGNSVYMDMQPGQRWAVYVMTSGYIVRPVRVSE